MNQAVEVSEIVIPRTPQVGEDLIILHEIKRSKDGTVIGLQRTGHPKTVPITAVYLDGSVRTGVSDRWEIKRNDRQGHGNVLWATVNNNAEHMKNEQ